MLDLKYYFINYVFTKVIFGKNNFTRWSLKSDLFGYAESLYLLQAFDFQVKHLHLPWVAPSCFYNDYQYSHSVYEIRN